LANRIVPPLPLMQDERVVQQPVDFDTLTDLFTERAIAYLQERKSQAGTPFFLEMAYYQPHVPQNPAPRFANTTLRGPYGDVVAEMDAR
jgi:hypothetical protein